MKKKLIILFILMTFYSNAQHCGYDYSGIVVLNVHSKKDITNIPNLRITLLDSLNKPVFTKTWKDGETAKRRFETDTLKFFQNPKSTRQRKNSQEGSNVRFPFAKENYVLICEDNFSIQNFKIKIEDIDGKKNQGQFKTIIIQPKQIKVYPLCGRYNLEVYPENLEVTEIILKRK
jgi:hypothetical protein